MTKNIKKLVILNIPYFLVGLVCTNLGEAWRIAQGTNASEKVQSLILDGAFGAAFANPMPSFIPFDLLIGALCGGAFRLAVYLKGKNAKKYRHNQEYGSARWGTHLALPVIRISLRPFPVKSANSKDTSLTPGKSIALFIKCPVPSFKYTSVCAIFP